jgi:hypothetical protein
VQDDIYGLLSPQIFDDPHSTYHLLRYDQPVHWSELLGCWLLTRYKDVHAMLRDRRVSSARRRPTATATLPEQAREKMVPIDDFLAMWMLNTDGPEHMRLRLLVNQFFTQREIDKLRPYIQTVADSLIDGFADAGLADVVADFAYPLPVTIIAEMIGFPSSDRAMLVAWFKHMAMYFQVGPARMQILEAMSRTIDEVKDYLRKLIEEKRKRPMDDILSKLAASSELGSEQLLSMCVLLLFSGHESTAALIGTSTLALLQHPAQAALLEAEPALMLPAIEEFLRMDGPFIRQDRVAASTIIIDDKVINSGDRVVLVLGAANRDPTRFHNPDRLDIRRRDNDHVAFGAGTHFCLGAQLARLETQIAMGTLLGRLTKLRFEGDGLRWREHYNHRGLLTLPVSFLPRAGAS